MTASIDGPVNGEGASGDTAANKTAEQAMAAAVAARGIIQNPIPVSNRPAAGSDYQPVIREAVVNDHCASPSGAVNTLECVTTLRYRRLLGLARLIRMILRRPEKSFPQRHPLAQLGLN